MMGRSHLIISTGLTLSIMKMNNVDITLPVIAVAAVSSLLPDIDEPNSLLVSKAIPTRFLRILQFLMIGAALFVQFYGNTLVPWNTVIAVLVGLVSFLPNRTLRKIVMILSGLGLIIFGHSFIPWNYIIGSVLIICSLVPHRGLTHTIYGVLGWTIILFAATYSYEDDLWIAGSLSYLLHLLADSLTNRGIRPLPPFKFKLKLKLMSTGTWTGSLIEKVFIGFTLIMVWYVFIKGAYVKHIVS